MMRVNSKVNTCLSESIYRDEHDINSNWRGATDEKEKKTKDKNRNKKKKKKKKNRHPPKWQGPYSILTVRAVSELCRVPIAQEWRKNKFILYLKVHYRFYRNHSKRNFYILTSYIPITYHIVITNYVPITNCILSKKIHKSLTNVWMTPSSRD